MKPPVTGSSNRDYKPAPQGTHLARCLYIVDLGTQTVTGFTGQQEQKHQVIFGWELVNTNEVFDETKGPQPHVVSKDFLFSMAPKSNLRKYVSLWAGRTITDAEAEAGFDISVLLGKACQLTVAQKQKRTDPTKIRADVTSIAPATIHNGTANVPMNVAPLRGQRMYFAIGSPDQFNAFKNLFPWLQKKIAASPEFINECAKFGLNAQALIEEAKREWQAKNPQPQQQQYQQPPVQQQQYQQPPQQQFQPQNQQQPQNYYPPQTQAPQQQPYQAPPQQQQSGLSLQGWGNQQQPTPQQQQQQNWQQAERQDAPFNSDDLPF